MAKEIVVQQHTLPGLADDAEAQAIADAFHRQIEDYGQGKLALPRLPTAQERAILEQRFSDLRVALRSASIAMADRERVQAALGRRFANMPSLRNANVVEMVTTYTLDLLDLPALCVEMACDDLRRGKIKEVDPAYPPTSTQIYKQAEAHRDRLYQAQYRPIERVLSVKMLSKPEQTEAQAARVGDLMRGLADGMKGDAEREETEKQTRRLEVGREQNTKLIHREWARLGLEPVMTKGIDGRSYPMSPAMARSMKLIPEESRSTHPNAPGRR